MTQFETIIRDAAREGVGHAIANEVREIVAKETRRALQEREDKLTALIRDAIKAALTEALM